MNRRKRNRRRFRLIVFLLLFTGVLVLLRFRYMPFLREAARTRVINVASDRINDAINAQISSGAVDYSRIIYLEKDVNGNITALRTNMAEVNRLKTLTLELLCGDLEAACLEQTAERGRGDTLAKTGHNAAGNENILSHNDHPPQ